MNEFPQHIMDLGDRLMNMTVAESEQLAEFMFDKYLIVPPGWLSPRWRHLGTAAGLAAQEKWVRGPCVAGDSQ